MNQSYRPTRVLVKVLLALALSACSGLRVHSDPPPVTLQWELVGMVDALQKALPVDKPVWVTEEALLPALLGQARPMGDFYLIAVDESLTVLEKQIVIAHEYAHVLAWSESGGRHGPQHDDEWGIQHARVFRFLVGEE